MANAIRKYIEKRADLVSRPLVSGPLDGIDQAVVIPVLAETDYLFHTLASLAENPEADLCRTLVLCVVNNRAEPLANRADIEDNRATLAMLDALVHGKEGAMPFKPGALRLAYVDASTPGNQLPEKGGVGLARKIGLDWALAVLEPARPSPRLLFSLDADTCVEPHYLGAVRAFMEARDARAAVVAYAHRLDGPPEQVAAILRYELFLRYHVLGLAYAGSPYAFPAIGSTIVCTAEAYAAVSGMNQRQAGEDFYFLQQLAKTVGVAQIHATTVHPSSRPSARVPFGTGPRVLRYLDDPEGERLVYHPESYRILKEWLAIVSAHHDSDADALIARAGAVSPQLATFLKANQFPRTWPRLRENAPDPAGLLAQFHRWFDGFKTLKLIHHLRDNVLPTRDLFQSALALLGMANIEAPDFERDCLHEDVAAQQRLLDFLREDAAKRA